MNVITQAPPLYKVYAIGENAFRLVVTQIILTGPPGAQGEQGEPGPPGADGAGEWGTITGDITDQTDLINYIDTALDGAGDVTGPASSTDNAVVRFDGITGKLLKDSLAILSNTGTLTIPEAIKIGTTQTIADDRLKLLIRSTFVPSTQSFALAEWKAENDDDDFNFEGGAIVKHDKDYNATYGYANTFQLYSLAGSAGTIIGNNNFVGATLPYAPVFSDIPNGFIRFELGPVWPNSEKMRLNNQGDLIIGWNNVRDYDASQTGTTVNDPINTFFPTDVGKYFCWGNLGTGGGYAYADKITAYIDANNITVETTRTIASQGGRIAEPLAIIYKEGNAIVQDLGTDSIKFSTNPEASNYFQISATSDALKFEKIGSIPTDIYADFRDLGWIEAPKDVYLNGDATFAKLWFRTSAAADIMHLKASTSATEYTNLGDTPHSFITNSITSFKVFDTKSQFYKPLMSGAAEDAPLGWLDVRNGDKNITAYIDNTRATGTNFGLLVDVAGSGAGENRAGYFTATGATTNKAIMIPSTSGAAAGDFAIDSQTAAKSNFAGPLNVAMLATFATVKITGGSPGAGKVLTSDADGDATWETNASGSGDVVGPASATDNSLALFDSITGKLLKEGVATLTSTRFNVITNEIAASKDHTGRTEIIFENYNTAGSSHLSGLTDGAAALSLSLYGTTHANAEQADFTLEGTEVEINAQSSTGFAYLLSGDSSGGYGEIGGGGPTCNFDIYANGASIDMLMGGSGLTNFNLTASVGDIKIQATAGIVEIHTDTGQAALFKANRTLQLAAYTAGLLVSDASGNITLDTSTYLTTGAASAAYQPLDSDLTTWAGITPGTGVGTFLATPSSANLLAAITDETGTAGSLVFSISPALTGSPTAPTQAANDNSTKIATTAYVDDRYSDSVRLMRTLGSTIIAEPYGVTRGSMGTNTALTDGQVWVGAIEVPTATITGVVFYSSTAGNFTADNENAVALYSFSGSTLTRVAISANDGNNWKQAGASMRTIAFTGTYAATKGIYYVALIYNNSAQVTAPNIGSTAIGSANHNVADITANVKMFGVLSSTALASSINMSSLSGSAVKFYLALY